MFPVVWLLESISGLLGRLFGLDPSDAERKMTEEEIRAIVEESGKMGNIDEEESEMIQNILDFSDTMVEEIMTHRTEISALNVSKGATLSKMAARLNIDAADCVSFGDNPNDFSMLQWSIKYG